MMRSGRNNTNNEQHQQPRGAGHARSHGSHPHQHTFHDRYPAASSTTANAMVSCSNEDAAPPPPPQPDGGQDDDDSSGNMAPIAYSPNADHHHPLTPDTVLSTSTPESNRSYFSETICLDAFLYTCSFCDAGSLRSVQQVQRRWRRACRTLDEPLWRPRCAALWNGKQMLHPGLSPFVQALDTGHPLFRVGEVLAREDSPQEQPKLATPEPEGSSVLQALRARKQSQLRAKAQVTSWLQAYYTSLCESRRTTLTSEELTTLISWQIEFLTAPHLPRQRVTFCGRSRTLNTENYPPLPYQLFDAGAKLHVHVFPALNVRRCPTTWSWIIRNAFVALSSLALTAPEAVLLPAPTTIYTTVPAATAAVVAPRLPEPAAAPVLSSTRCEPPAACCEAVVVRTEGASAAVSAHHVASAPASCPPIHRTMEEQDRPKLSPEDTMDDTDYYPNHRAAHARYVPDDPACITRAMCSSDLFEKVNFSQPRHQPGCWSLFGGNAEERNNVVRRKRQASLALVRLAEKSVSDTKAAQEMRDEIPHSRRFGHRARPP